MKRFSLNKKRVSKALALALVAAMVVPGVPAQKSAAEGDGSSVTLPDPIATVNFANSKKFSMSDSVTGQQLKFTTATAKAVWNIVTSDGSKTDGTYESTDYVPEMAAGATDKYDVDSYAWEEIDVAPTMETVSNDAVSGGALNALSLKSTVDVEDTYPKAVPGDYGAIQRKKRYSSAVEITNPFAGSTDLYDASRYSMANIAATATEVVRKDMKAVESSGFVQEGLGDFTGPKADKGVTISFWAQTPAGKDALAETNYFEFYNNSSLIYSPDDLSKSWGAYAIDHSTADDFNKNKDSLVYKGEVVTGSLILVGDNYKDTVKKATGKDFNSLEGTVPKPEWTNGGIPNNNANAKLTDVSGCALEVTFVKDAGEFAAYYPGGIEYYQEQKAYLAGDEVTIKNEDGEDAKVKTGSLLLVAWKGTVETFGADYQKGWSALNKMMFVTTGETDDEGNHIIYGVAVSKDVVLDTEYWDQAGWHASYYVPYKEDAESKSGYASSVRYKTDATGVLYASEKTTFFSRDYNQYDDLGTKTDGNGYTGTYLQNGEEKAGQLQANNTANVDYDNSDVGPAEWHYYTVSISDDWFQMYIDGEAVEVVKGYNKDKFNLCSGLYDPINEKTYQPDGKNNGWYNAYKLYSRKANGPGGIVFDAWGYGAMFGESVMSFITDENTKLYIGGKTQKTAEDTLIANVALFDEKMSPEQAAALYEAACDDAIAGFEVDNPDDPDDPDDPDNPNPPTPSGNALGNVTGDIDKEGNPIINSQDALAVLQYSVGIIDAGEGFDLSVANVNGDDDKDGNPIINSQDALEILQYSVGIIDHFSAEDK